MKIAIISPDDLSILIIFKELINALKNDNRFGKYKIYTISPITEHIKELNKLATVHIPINMYRYLSVTRDLKYLFQLYRIFRKEKFDIIINLTTKPIIYGTIAAHLIGSAKVMSAIRGLGSSFSFFNDAGKKDKLIKYIILSLYWLACRWSTKIWFTNKEDLNYFILKGVVIPPKVILTKNAINVNYFSPLSVNKDTLTELRKELGIDVNDKVIVMVARLIWPKGIKEFIEASEILKGKKTNIKFILVAPPEPGSTQQVPETYIREKEKIGNFLWLGFRKDVREIYAICDIAVLPSYYKEGGYPRALLEPMAMSKPVIAANTPDCSGPVRDGENGFLIPPKDSVSLAKTIECLINDKEKMEKFGQSSRIIVEQEFDERIVFSRIVNELYQM